MRSRIPYLCLPAALCLLWQSSLLPQQAAPARKPAAGKKAPAPVGKPQAAQGPDLTGPYNAYLNRLRSKVLQNWDFPPGKYHVVLQVVVNADGSAAEPTLSSSPHGDAAEKAASAAFAQAQPLEPLPEKSTPTVRITMNFDSSYDPHGDSNSSLSAKLDPIQPPKLKAAPPAAGTAGETSSEPAAGSGGDAPAAGANP